MRPIHRKIAVILVFFVITGLLRGGWESSLDRRLTAATLLREPPAEVDWRQRLRQEVLSALFGKLRSIMAIYWTLAGMEDWADKDWPGVDKNFRMAADLDPNDVDLWSFYIWHLETNAASYWTLREDLPETVRDAEAMQWVLKGLDVADRALQYHPDSSKLLSQTAKIYLDKMKTPCTAAEYYKRARDGDAPMSFLVRFFPYTLALCSGNEEEAYRLLMDLYNEGKQHRVPTMIRRINALEERLNIPAANRIKETYRDLEILKKYPHAKKVFDELDLENDASKEKVYLNLKFLYDRGKEFRSPILIRSLKSLEEQLNVPAADRISDPDPDPDR